MNKRQARKVAYRVMANAAINYMEDVRVLVSEDGLDEKAEALIEDACEDIMSSLYKKSDDW